MNKRIVEEIVVGGLSGLALVLVYLLIRAYSEGADAGDWLQFAGAMMGTGLAVVGALYVEKRRREHEQHQGHATLLDVLKQMDSSFEDVAEPLSDDLSEAVSEINARRFFLETTKGYAEFVLTQHLTPSSKVWRSTSGLNNYIERILSVDWFAHDANNGEDGCDAETVAHWYQRVSNIATSARKVVARVIAEQEESKLETT